MSKYCVYKHTSPNDKIYVGITSRNPLKRWDSGYGYYRHTHFYNSILKYGWNNFKHEIVCENLSKEEACEMEIELIAKYKSNNREYGYNQSLGDECNFLGKKHSLETKQKISEANKGRKFSKEHLQKLSNSHKGQVSWCKGKKLSKEHAQKARENGKMNQRSVINIDTKTKYPSLKEAERQTGIHRQNISNCCKGNQKTAGGFIWEYAI